MRLIDADELLNKTIALEAEALEKVVKYEPLSDKKPSEWHTWNCVLAERTAFKYDLLDAPTVDAEPVRHGYWTECKDSHSFECSVCHTWSVVGGHYCDWCGAKMDAEEETEVWNCFNGRKIVAPKGTFDKIYYGEIKDEDV